MKPAKNKEFFVARKIFSFRGKAQALFDTSAEYAIWRILLVIIIAGTLFVFLTNNLNYALGSHDIENTILIKRLIYSPNLLAYTDKGTGRVYPGIIDLDKFDTSKIEAEFANEDKSVAVNMELTDLTNNEVKRAYVNEERARIWDNYVIVGGFDASTLKRYIQIYDQGKLKPGIIRIKVIVKR
jgi:hypothetical protein